MQVQELIEELSKYPSDMEVVISYCSDYSAVSSLETVEAVDKGYYVMRGHATMNENSQDKKIKIFMKC